MRLEFYENRLNYRAAICVKAMSKKLKFRVKILRRHFESQI